MTKGIDPDHKDLFSDLYDSLTEDEGVALLNSVKEMKVPIDSVIHRQGSSNNALYFVNSGKLRIGIKSGDRRLFVKILLPGDIFGSETFFSNSTCTATIIAFVATTLYRIDKDDFRRLKAKHTGLETKLQTYCDQVGTVSSHVREKKMNRREETREAVSGKAVAQFISNSGNLVGKPIQVGLSDISRGGTSFLIRLSNEEKADYVLGRKLLVQYNTNDASPPATIQTEGTIVAIVPTEFHDFSFHLKFDEDLTAQEYSSILSAYPENG
jgi:CRP-like cAMP-binding protein